MARSRAGAPTSTRCAVDYVLRVLGGLRQAFRRPGTLLILVGDHQPAPLIAGEGASRDVPMHVIGGEPALVAPFLAWGFTPGMLPAAAAPARAMDASGTGSSKRSAADPAAAQ